jgi:hypothetical protein
MATSKTPPMWILEPDLAIDVLPPSDQLWVIAQAVEENGGPRDYVGALRQLAERLEDTSWWLREAAKN